MKILALSGSVRGASTTVGLLHAAASLAPAGMAFTFYDRQLEALPQFNPDYDGEGATPPSSVATLRACIRDADGVLISCPEYAHGVPGAFKNALDWTVSSGEFERKPVALLVASPTGGPYAHAALTPTLNVLGANLVLETALVFSKRHLAADGTLVKPADAEAVLSALDRLRTAISQRQT